MSLRLLLDAYKSIPSPLQWSKPDPEDGYMRIYTRLEIGGIVDAGLVLSGGTYAHLPDRHVSFELAILGSDGHRRTRLARVDWRDLKGGHSNNRGKCPGSIRRAPATHLHSFALNWDQQKGRMKRGKLPCAEAISEDLQTFEELRRYVGTHFRINNIDIVPRPDWVYDLFNEAR